MKSKQFWLCMVLIGTQAIHLPVLAASFDCATAKTSQEKLICQDYELSNLDTQLGVKYEERLKLLSLSGAKLFRSSERRWLHFISIVCSVDHGSWGDRFHNPRICLTKEYRDRLEQLNMVGQKIGPFVFNRIDIYAAEPAPDKNGWRTGFYYQHAAYPQIDHIENTTTNLWNKQMMKPLPTGECDGGKGDFDTDYKMGYASNRLISMTWMVDTYCHGTPHGFGGPQLVNTVLYPTPHRLISNDVFGSGQDWKPKLQALFMNELLKQGWKPRTGTDDKLYALKAFINPDRWLFTDKGIELDFKLYEVCAYACTPQPVTVSWESIKPLLSPTSVVP